MRSAPGRDREGVNGVHGQRHVGSEKYERRYLPTTKRPGTWGPSRAEPGGSPRCFHPRPPGRNLAPPSGRPGLSASQGRGLERGPRNSGGESAPCPAALAREAPRPGWLRPHGGPTGERSAGQGPGLHARSGPGELRASEGSPATQTQNAPCPLGSTDKQPEAAPQAGADHGRAAGHAEVRHASLHRTGPTGKTTSPRIPCEASLITGRASSASWSCRWTEPKGEGSWTGVHLPRAAAQHLSSRTAHAAPGRVPPWRTGQACSGVDVKQDRVQTTRYDSSQCYNATNPLKVTDVGHHLSTVECASFFFSFLVF